MAREFLLPGSAAASPGTLGTAPGSIPKSSKAVLWIFQKTLEYPELILKDQQAQLLALHSHPSNPPEHCPNAPELLELCLPTVTF